MGFRSREVLVRTCSFGRCLQFNKVLLLYLLIQLVQHVKEHGIFTDGYA